MGKYESCGKGITMRGIRRAFCDELHTNPELVAVIGRACGVNYMQEVGEIAMKNQGGDLRLCCVTRRGSAITIRVDVQIDSVDGGLDYKQDGELPAVRSVARGVYRRVTVAPEPWFRHLGNASQAENMVTFESLHDLASDDFFLALVSGERRSQHSFDELLRPKTSLPMWAIRRLGRH